VRLRKELTDAGLDAGPDTIAWHLTHHHRSPCRGPRSAAPDPPALVTPSRRSDPSPPTSASKPRCPTRPGSPTSPTTDSPTRRPPRPDVEIISWLDDCTRYALHVSAHPRITTPIVLATFRKPQTSTDPRIHAHRQRHGLHRPTGRPRPRRPQLLRTSNSPTRHRDPEELPPQPPHHLRQGRAVPADDEEVATRPTRPAEHDHRAPGPPRRLRRRVQPPPPAPLPATPRHPATLYDSMPKALPGATATPTPTTGSATTASMVAGAGFEPATSGL
jgi:hypothetical protein